MTQMATRQRPGRVRGGAPPPWPAAGRGGPAIERSVRPDGRRLPGTRVRRLLLTGAVALIVVAIFLPVWGMTLVSVQYPEGLRMVVYPMQIRGDITEINLLNHYIGMAEISNDYFIELRLIPALFGAIALACLLAALVRRVWATVLPLVLMAGTAAFGFWSMQHRLHEYGNNLDPTAAIDIEPFTPPMLGENVIAQFGTYAYFSWGTFLPIIAGALVAAALWLDLRAPGRALAHRMNGATGGER